MSVEQTLVERQSAYGEFRDNGLYAQRLKDVVRGSKNWQALEAYQKEAIDMILHKLARVLAGDPNYTDHWHDIQGYAKLVEDRVGNPIKQGQK